MGNLIGKWKITTPGNSLCPKDHWTLKTGYFEDQNTPAIQVQTLPLEGPRSLGWDCVFLKFHFQIGYQVHLEIVLLDCDWDDVRLIMEMGIHH